MALELLSLSSTFENSTKSTQISFDSDSFLEWLKGLWNYDGITTASNRTSSPVGTLSAVQSS